MAQQAGLLCQVSLADSRVAPIGKSIAWVRDHFDERLSRPYFAKLAGMSQAIFYSQFKAATAMTPVQFQKGLRLQEARRMLLSEGVDVAQVGFAIGYKALHNSASNTIGHLVRHRVVTKFSYGRRPQINDVLRSLSLA